MSIITTDKYEIMTNMCMRLNECLTSYMTLYVGAYTIYVTSTYIN